MDTAPDNPAARHKAACERERDAWGRVEKCGPRRPIRRKQDVDGWLEATRAFRDSQAELTAISIHRAKQALRESAALLSDASPAPEPASLVGSRYVDDKGTLWEIKDVVADVFEPGFFLVQIAPADAGDVDPIDVYSDDWQLFCLIHRLRPA